MFGQGDAVGASALGSASHIHTAGVFDSQSKVNENIEKASDDAAAIGATFNAISSLMPAVPEGLVGEWLGIAKVCQPFKASLRSS